MKKIIKCDPLILETLKRATNEEVDFLVDVITYHGSGRIGLSSSIKDLLLSEKTHEPHYSEDALRYLIHEFQAYGGHSVANIFRNKELLAYDEILTDVYKKLNGTDSKNKSVSQKEKEIVLGLFGAEWLNLSDEDRFDRATNAKVILGYFKLSDNLNFDEKGAAFGLSALVSASIFAACRIIPPAALLSSLVLLNQSVSEAYRITIPFLAQIGWIRMRLSK